MQRLSSKLLWILITVLIQVEGKPSGGWQMHWGHGDEVRAKRQWPRPGLLTVTNTKPGQLRWLICMTFELSIIFSPFLNIQLCVQVLNLVVSQHRHFGLILFYPGIQKILSSTFLPSVSSGVLDSCSSSQPRWRDSSMLCFWAISSTRFSSNSSSTRLRSMSRSWT